MAIGDRLEMGRGTYQHWAVYVGEQSFKGRKVSIKVKITKVILICGIENLCRKTILTMKKKFN